jgi:NADPH:quinone reductase-like Zn-dependent oxidoreductase
MSELTGADQSMYALRAHRRGGPEQLVYELAPRPPLGIGDVLVRVQAASFTATELGWPSTWTDRLGRDRTPVVPAHELSGVVAALGFGTTGLTAGDEVYGLVDWYRDGAAAGYVAVEARNLALKPATVDHVQAAAVPLAALTAWQALFDHGRLEAGQAVLVHGAAGGVGSFAVQLAHAAGGRVVATGRAPDLELLAELGADQVIDAGQRRFEETVGPVDLVLDLVGGDVALRSWPLVKPGGALVTVVGGTPTGPPRPDARWVFFVVEADRAELAELGRRIDGGRLRAIVSRVWPLAEGGQAFQAKQHGGLPGKAVLQVADQRQGPLWRATHPCRTASPRPSARQEAGGQADAGRGPVRSPTAPVEADHDP